MLNVLGLMRHYDLEENTYGKQVSQYTNECKAEEDLK